MVLLVEDVKLLESDESMFCRFSISVLGMSNKFSIEVSTKNVVDVVESLICFVELEIWNMIISFHGIVSH